MKTKYIALLMMALFLFASHAQAKKLHEKGMTYPECQTLKTEYKECRSSCPDSPHCGCTNEWGAVIMCMVANPGENKFEIAQTLKEIEKVPRPALDEEEVEYTNQFLESAHSHLEKLLTFP